MKGNYEFIEHTAITDLNIFLVQLTYRGPHWHREFETCMIMSGTLQVTCGEQTYEFHTGDIFMFNPYQIHELRALTESVYILSVQVASGFCKRMFPEIHQLRIDCVPLFHDPTQCVRHSGRQIRNLHMDLSICYFKRERAWMFRCMGYLYELYAAILSSHPSIIIDESERTEQTLKAQRLQRIMDYIDGHYTDKILLSDIAEEEHLSMHYLSHFFKEMVGVPFQEYLALYRYEHARHLVEHTDKSISDICLECGFSDYRYLNKIYIRQLGYSPREYRKTHPIQSESQETFDTKDTQTFLSADDSLMLLEIARNTRHFQP